MKVERYIIEYANAKIKAITANELMNGGIKNELIRRIDRAVNMRRLGQITQDEAIMIIGGFIPKDEDFSEYMN